MRPRRPVPRPAPQLARTSPEPLRRLEERREKLRQQGLEASPEEVRRVRERVRALPPEERRARERLFRHRDLPESEREHIRENARAFHSMSDEERDPLPRASQQLRDLPEDERREMLDRLLSEQPAR